MKTPSCEKMTQEGFYVRYKRNETLFTGGETKSGAVIHAARQIPSGDYLSIRDQ
jgi:hypothetical protein